MFASRGEGLPRPASVARTSWILALLLLASCGSGGPEVQSLELRLLEDEYADGQMMLVSGGASVAYHLASSPLHGRVELDSASGRFTYWPDRDHNGADSFTYVASDGAGKRSRPARVTISIEPVNDPPSISADEIWQNSAESRDTRIPVSISDVDGDRFVVTVTVEDPSVASARYSEEGEIVVTPLEYGETRIHVHADDGAASSSLSLAFTVGDVVRKSMLEAETPVSAKVRIHNRSDQSVSLVLSHNSSPVFENVGHIVAHVRDLPDELPSEHFARKLWRFLRDSSVHYWPLMPLQFKHAPWATLNSLGFGFCGDISTTYVTIARAAGYNARVWALYNHVVPEIEIDGSWQVYDPDLAVYYHTRDGRVAGVDDLAADSTLVSDPVNPILPRDSAAYSEYYADIYGTTHNNAIADYALLPEDPEFAGRFVLPPGAVLSYPGRWTSPPTAYAAFGEVILKEDDLQNWRQIAESYDDGHVYSVDFHRQAKIDIPAGWSGELSLPLWVWETAGVGILEIDGVLYEVGSEALSERLQRYLPVRGLNVVSSRGLSLIMQLNAVTFQMDAKNEVILTGKDVWALDTEVVGSEHAAGEPLGFSRIRAIVDTVGEEV